MIVPTPLQAEFRNQYGERLVLRAHPASGVGQLFGDEISWDEPIEIRDGTVQADFIFGEDEWSWLESAWQEITGRCLQIRAFDQFRELLKQLR